MTTAQIKRRIPRKAALLAAIVAVLMLAGVNTLAFHVGTAIMELDGNVADDGAGVVGDTDWVGLFNADGTEKLPPLATTLDTTGVIRDFVAGASGPDPSYHEPSNKDDQPINAAGGSSVWGCGQVANATDKNDILNAYALASKGTGDDLNDLILHFGAERFDNSGTAFLGVWFFQADVTCDLTTSKFVGTKTNNDILALVNFSNGGGNVTIQAFAWHPAATNPGSNPGSFTLIGQGVTCSTTADNNGNTTPGLGDVDMCAQVNVANNVFVPWGTEDKPKPGGASANPANTLEPAEFIEGGINLTDAFAAAGQTAPGCFGSFMAETRSSDTVSATLKDFVLADLNTCDASVTINPSATNRVGASHTFTVQANQLVSGATTAATDGHAIVTLTNSNGAAVDVTAATCEVLGDPDFGNQADTLDNLNGAGQCTVTFTSPSTGIVTGNVSVAPFG